MKFELNEQGVRELLKSVEMANICQEYADKALGKLGEGYSSNVHVGKNRVNVEIKADTQKARNENMEQNTIWKAVRSG